MPEPADPPPPREISVPEPSELAADDRNQLREARRTLEHHGIADRLAEWIGMPITASLRALPGAVEESLHAAVQKSLSLALDVAVRSLGEASATNSPRIWQHKLLAGLSGAAGGALGGATVAAELPVSTVLILRSVADIARSEGEDLSQLEVRMACLEVFALDASRGSLVEDDTELGYFAVRAGLAKQIKDASRHIVQHGLRDRSAPPLVKLLSTISQRFGVVVSEKLAAQAVPVIGAVGGALINSFFIDHYQDLARAHFTIRRLERRYSPDLVRRAYKEVGSERR